jgi:hypothetical protein
MRKVEGMKFITEKQFAEGVKYLMKSTPGINKDYAEVKLLGVLEAMGIEVKS